MPLAHPSANKMFRIIEETSTLYPSDFRSLDEYMRAVQDEDFYTEQFVLPDNETDLVDLMNLCTDWRLYYVR